MKTMRITAAAGQSRCSVLGCEAEYYGATFCKNHHQWHWKRGLLPQPILMTTAEKLRSYAEVDVNTGCWIWQRCVNNKGYGRVALAGTDMFAHRASYECFVGSIASGLEVCHRCDTPPCINPDHLFLGTHAENMRDSSNKGRTWKGGGGSGLKHTRAALTAEEVRFVRSSPLSPQRLAPIVGASWMTIHRCKRRETYRDVE